MVHLRMTMFGLVCGLLVPSVSFAHDYNAECVANLGSKGGIFSGKTFKSSAAFSDAPATVLKKVYFYLVKDGWDTKLDKDLGVVTASKSVESVNFIVQDGGGSSSTVTITDSLPAGYTGYQMDKALCGPLDGLTPKRTDVAGAH